jgi:hypothetical protein
LDGGFVKVDRLRVFAPFLFVDGVLVLVVVWLLELDWIVHNVLYGYGLVFSVDWAVPYWVAFRMSLGLILFSVAVVTVVGFVSFRRVRLESEKTVFLCKACGRVWVELDRNMRMRGELPKFRILLSCPSCDRRLLDLETGIIQNNELEARGSSGVKG